MGALGYGLDTATEQMVTTGGYLLYPAYVFPGVTVIGQLMPLGQGGPGSMIEGAQEWLNGASALQRAKGSLDGIAGSVSADTWSGDDRQLFDVRVREMSEQLGIAATFAMGVGAGLAGLSAPLLAYGPVCLSIGGVLLAEAITFEIAVASVVGNLGASEAAYAAGCATAATCLEVMIGMVAGIGAVMSLAAAALKLGSLTDAGLQQHHGDGDALATYGKAEVEGLEGAGENLLDWGVSVGSDALAAKALGGAKFPPGWAGHVLSEEAEGAVSDRIQDGYNAGKDLVEGNPGDALKDLTGYGDEIDAVEDLLGKGDEPLPADHTHYSLPAPPSAPPVQPIPPAPGGAPNIEPIPNADPDEYQVIPAGSDINEGVDTSTTDRAEQSA